MFGSSKKSAPPPRGPSPLGQEPAALRPGGVVRINDVAQVIWQDRFAIPAALREQFELDPAFVALTRLLVTFPQGEQLIKGESSTPWNHGLIKRYYLDDDAGMLQMVTDREGKPLGNSVEFFSLFHQEQPSDLSLWLPVPGSEARQGTWWVGNAAYPLPGLPLDEDGTWAQWSYRRSWTPDPSVTAVPPRELNEAIRLSDGRAQAIDHRVMAYHRPPPAAVLNGSLPPYGPIADQSSCEQMLLNADHQQGTTTVRLWVGVELDLGDVIL